MNPRELVSERYQDALGMERIVPAATREAFTAALTATASAAGGGIAPRTRILREGDPLTIDVTLAAEHWDESLLWTVRDERGAVKAGTLPLRDAPVIRTLANETSTIDTRRITLPFTVASGTYRVTLDVRTYGHAGIDVIVAPKQSYLPPRETRIWGLAVQLYTLRSERNWGIGDFGDLARVFEIAADAGATLVGINPLHAAHRSDPEAASPYSPTSRLFLNWLAIDVEALPEAADPDVQHYVMSVRDDLAALREKPFVDYTGVAMVKAPALKLCFAALGGARAEKFADFVRAGGDSLARFALHEALVARFGRNVADWPEDYRAGEGKAVKAFTKEAVRAIDFAMYVQWCAAEQLEIAAAAGRKRGVKLYRDLAVGVESNGAEAWGGNDYISIASVGAPPDLLNTKGQDWGLPPFSPTAMQRDAYASFAALLAANMRDAGALRVDHAMSLMRLFWIPHGSSAAEGGYVAYPFDDLLGIVARESARAKCMVIGEDLGTVPSGFRERMAANHVLSYRILLFEREGDGAFIAPDAYPELALAATGTHDMPPLAGWLIGDDIDLRARLSGNDEEAGRERASREVDISQLRAALLAHGDLPESGAYDAEQLMLASYRFLAKTPARIVMLQIEDAIGEITPVNVPGTDREYPNWRRKLHVDLETIASDERFERFAATLRGLRPR